MMNTTTEYRSIEWLRRLKLNKIKRICYIFSIFEANF